MPLDFSRLQLLLVDDNDFMRSVYRELLEAIGFRKTNLAEAVEGTEALQLLQMRHIDIVICDLNMRPMNGKKFTRYIRTDPNSSDPYLPIIICTGHAEMVHIAHARDCGAHEILRKPVSASSLYARLQSVIETPRPFILSPNFVGPDRRRQNLPFDGPDRRSQTIDL